MELIMTVSVAIIAFSMILIMAAVVATLLRVRGLLRELEKFVETARMHLPGLLHDVTQISADARSIVRSVERDISKLGRAFDSVRDTAQDLHDFERRLRQRLEHPLLDIFAVSTGVWRGLRAFWHALRR